MQKSLYIYINPDCYFPAKLYFLVADAEIQSAAEVIFESFRYLQPFNDLTPSISQLELWVAAARLGTLLYDM